MTVLRSAARLRSGLDLAAPLALGLALALGGLALVVLAPAARSTGGPAPVPEGAVRTRDVQAPDVESQRRAIAARLVTALEELAALAGERRLARERFELCEAILRLDPDHEAARKALGYRRKKGEWARAKEPAPPAPSPAARAAELAAERTERTRADVTAMLALVDGAEPPLPPARVDAILADLWAVDPASPELRARAGEVLHEGAWVLAETATAKRRRAELRAGVRAAMAATQAPAAATPSEAERELGVDWTSVLVNEDVRLLCSGSAAEAETAARIVDATEAVFALALGAEVELFDGYTVYLLSKGDRDKGPFVASLPKLTESQRDFLGQLVGGGLPGTADCAWWCDSEAKRLDGLVRHTLGNLLFRAWTIGVQHGWVWEGLSIYLTREMVGTRLTIYVRPSEYELPSGDDLAKKLLDSDTNWMNAAYEMLTGPKPPKLAFLLGKDVNAMRTEDMLLSYALGAYLVEGRPAETPHVLARIGAGDEPHAVLEQELGLAIPDLQARLVRWLSERR